MSGSQIPEQRRRLSPEQRREEIMAVGLEIFATGSLTQISVNEIAKRAGVSRALFYHYFPSKIDLARAIVAHEISQVHRIAGAESIEGVVTAYITYVQGRPMGYRALHIGGLENDPVIGEAIRASQVKFEEILLNLLSIPLTDQQARFALRTWTNTVIATCLQWLEHPEIDSEEIAGMMIRTLHALVPTGRGQALEGHGPQQRDDEHAAPQTT
ncbi:TetR/AcrR family transcriptional regulator [Actinomyces bowdenii]|uniref:TetR/AcrR family transcriptional regulator n=1 Tax=Actinomyces bowdenii TaxID=131109 RepID=A0A853EQF5_9ACTO|nr:TetR/AcrR family transcriptional regulator [Actinomyces bowdenii]MBF0698189.1 TetR/AcrR family transcriptional regulator [Actinomyces bowdenii]NYS70361.1 TetR/AcrR family transcriptional regulator [Actinomyces bowdenii]